MTCFVPAIFVVGLTASSDKVGNHVFRSTGAKMSALVGISWRSRDMHQSIASASLNEQAAIRPGFEQPAFTGARSLKIKPYTIIARRLRITV